MRILADENIDRQIVERLRWDGHNVDYIIEMSRGISDDVILNIANQEHDVLLTADKDFGELIYRQGQVANTVILVRLGGLSPLAKASIVSSVFAAHELELEQAFVVVAPGSLRIRHRRD